MELFFDESSSLALRTRRVCSEICPDERPLIAVALDTGEALSLARKIPIYSPITPVDYLDRKVSISSYHPDDIIQLTAEETELAMQGLSYLQRNLFERSLDRLDTRLAPYLSVVQPKPDLGTASPSLRRAARHTYREAMRSLIDSLPDHRS